MFHYRFASSPDDAVDQQLEGGLSRRTFIKTGAAVGGGCYSVSACQD